MPISLSVRPSVPFDSPISPIFQAVLATPFCALGVRTEADRVKELSYLPESTPLRPASEPLAREVARQIKRYLKDPRFTFELPLAPQGSAFQQRVGGAIATIAPGQVLTYGAIARRLQSAPRAVGQACGANWYPLVIPCHRVIAAHGIGGFGGKAQDSNQFQGRIKRWLLQHEGASDARLRA